MCAFHEFGAGGIQRRKFAAWREANSFMQVDVDPFQIEEAHYTELVEILMVEATDEFDMDVEKPDQIPKVTGDEVQLVYP